MDISFLITFIQSFAKPIGLLWNLISSQYEYYAVSLLEWRSTNNFEK